MIRSSASLTLLVSVGSIFTAASFAAFTLVLVLLASGPCPGLSFVVVAVVLVEASVIALLPFAIVIYNAYKNGYKKDGAKKKLIGEAKVFSNLAAK
jgi:hypothetical protein